MEALICQVGVPAMSVSKFGNYVKILANDVRFNKMPTYRFITRLTLVPHPTYQFVMEFMPMSAIEDVDVLKAVMARVRAEAKDLVLAPFPPSTVQAEESKGGKVKKPLPTAKPGVEKGGRSRFGAR